VGDRRGLTEHDRRGAILFSRQVHGPLDHLRFQAVAGDDETGARDFCRMCTTS
jgi:hypothetical protein